MVETTGAEVGAWGCPSEMVDTTFFFGTAAVETFLTATPKKPPAYEGSHPGGAGLDGEILAVTPWGMAMGDA
jgi:hypothetical protein